MRRILGIAAILATVAVFVGCGKSASTETKTTSTQKTEVIQHGTKPAVTTGKIPEPAAKTP